MRSARPPPGRRRTKSSQPIQSTLLRSRLTDAPAIGTTVAAAQLLAPAQLTAGSVPSRFTAAELNAAAQLTAGATIGAPSIPATLVPGNLISLAAQSFEDTDREGQWSTNYRNPAETSTSIVTDAYDGTYARSFTTTGTDLDFFGPEIAAVGG